MIRWRIETAKPEHIPPIAGNMREADKREVWASNRRTPEDALRISLRGSDMAWTCFVDDVPAFMWGVGRIGCLFSDIGTPWLLGTNRITAIKQAFLKQSRAYVERMQERFPRLENYVHGENKLSVRWLRWCGFSLAETPTHINGEPFFLFWREM